MLRIVSQFVARVSFVVLLVAFVAQAQVVEVVVKHDLWETGNITTKVNRYIQDVQDQGYGTILTTEAFESPEALRAHFIEQYNTQDSLVGVVLIGDIDTATYEVSEWYWDPTIFPDGGWLDGSCYNMRGLFVFQTDLFFMDLDGVWENLVEEMYGDNGAYFHGYDIYDSHTGDTAPEIWLGRIATSSLTELGEGRTEAGLINNYLDKNHAYRTGQTRVPMDNTLLHVSELGLFLRRTTQWEDTLETVGDVTTVAGIADGATASDFKTRLSTPWEHIVVVAGFNLKIDRQTWSSDPPGEPTTLFNYELEDADPQCLFINLVGGEWLARYSSLPVVHYPYEADPIGYPAGEYVFSEEGEILLAIGSMGKGYMGKDEEDDLSAFYGPLLEGATFGEALRQWYIAAEGWEWPHIAPCLYVPELAYGMTIIGDPLLQTQRYMPRPGDANLDGAVNLADNIILAANWNQSPRGWSEGDFNCDGVVNLSDLIIMAGNWD